jgi:putative ABC transport system permease protein
VKFRHLAIKNVKENWYQYAAYFFCCMSSVTVFYIFQSLIFHPDIGRDIDKNHFMRGFLSATQVLIVVFSFVFVLYSNATFLKSRKKEFGLLMMLGMTRGQLKRLVFYENTTIALLSIGAGIFVGMMFSKLFFMAVSVILKLDQPIGFTVVPQAIYWTAIGYLVLFEVISFFTSMTIGRRNLIRFFKIRFGPKLSMFFSIVFTLVSIGLLTWGYYWASTATLYNFGPRVVPVVAIVTIGTYFLFRNASVVILRLLEKVKPFFYKRTSMLSVSFLRDKMKENARVLFNVTIASAVILTAAGATYSMTRVFGQQTQDQYPQTIGISSKGLSVKDVIPPDQVE